MWCKVRLTRHLTSKIISYDLQTPVDRILPHPLSDDPINIVYVQTDSYLHIVLDEPLTPYQMRLIRKLANSITIEYRKRI